MSGWPLPWRTEVEERRKAEQVQRNTREAARQADHGQPPQQHMRVTEDEHGFVQLENYRIAGPSWSAQHAEVEGEPWSWLHGEAS